MNLREESVIELTWYTIHKSVSSVCPLSVGLSSVGPSSVGPSSVGPLSVGPSSVGPSAVFLSDEWTMLETLSI